MGARAFLLLWFGQLVSALGSGLCTFALGVWVFQRTGSTTDYALIATLGTLPAIALMPIAGALVDRWGKRTALFVADLGSGLMSLVVATSFWTGRHDLLPIYAAVGGGAIFSSLRWPAYAAAVGLLVPKDQLGRASGMVQMAEAVAQIVCPSIAGALLLHIGVEGILLIDVASFVVALSTLVALRLPPTPREAAGPRAALCADMAFGWSYIRAEKGLSSLLVLFAASNFFEGIALVLATPLLLVMAGPRELGLVLTASGAGMLAGTLLMSAWGGPRRRASAVLASEIALGIAVASVGVCASIPLIAAGSFFFLFFGAIRNASSQALWQTHVAPALQGRVFAVRRMLALSTQPLAFFVAGPLDDHVFEPLLVAGGPLASTVGAVFGVGPGRGTGILYLVLGAAIVSTTVTIARACPSLRRMDEAPLEQDQGLGDERERMSERG